MTDHEKTYMVYKYLQIVQTDRESITDNIFEEIILYLKYDLDTYIKSFFGHKKMNE